jgi:hypothetical protein
LFQYGSDGQIALDGSANLIRNVVKLLDSDTVNYEIIEHFITVTFPYDAKFLLPQERTILFIFSFVSSKLYIIRPSVFPFGSDGQIALDGSANLIRNVVKLLDSDTAIGGLKLNYNRSELAL